MEHSNHISVEEANGSTIVVVDDYELFDLLDDLFTERGFMPSFISKNFGADGVERHSFHFASKTLMEELVNIVREIPLAEIERLISLNKE